MRNHLFITAAAVILSMIGYSVIQYYANQDNIIVHNDVFNEFRELNDRLSPILDQIPNATDAKSKQDRHYEQTAEDFKILQDVKNILVHYGNSTERLADEERHYEVLKSVNKTLSGLINDIPPNLATTIG